jgi:fluoroquinolone transport system permease protein
MAILIFAPLLLLIVFKGLLIFIPPLLLRYLSFDFTPYLNYVLGFVLLTNSGMLGIVTGFMMLDERDGHIAELMSVTPLGRSGYLFHRLLFASLLTVLYSVLAVPILNVSAFPIVIIILLSLLSAFYTAIVGLLLFAGAEDKVKGLTYAKALNVLMLFAFTDLAGLPWLTALSWIFPTYWLMQLIQNPLSLPIIGLAITSHSLWMGILIIRWWKNG